MNRRPDGVRFAVLTDTHVSHTDRPYNREAIEAAVAEINADDDLDFVVFSGDLTVNGAAEDVRLGHEMLSRIAKPFFAIPGNHESCWSDNQCRVWKELFGDWHFAADFGKYRLIGLRTGPFMHMAPARVDAHELEFLRREFADLAPGREVILVVHEPIDDGLANWREFAAALDPARVAVCVGGHLHSNKLGELCGIPDLIFRQLASKTGEFAPGYGIVELSDRRVAGFNRETGVRTIRVFDIDRQSDGWKAPAARFFPAAPLPVRNPENLQRIYAGGATLYSSPLPLDDGKVVLGDADGKLTALDGRSGEVVWQCNLDGAVFAGMDRHDGVIAVGTLDGVLYGVAETSGEKRWELRLDAPVTGDAFFYRDGFFVGDAAGTFRKIAAASGEVLFKEQIAAQRFQKRGAVKDGVIYIGAWDGTLYAINADDGGTLWHWKSERNYRFYSPGNSGIVARNGKVYFAFPDRWVRALDGATGKELWASDYSMVRESFAASADGSLLLAKTLDCKLSLIPTDGGAPTQIPLEVAGKLGDTTASAQGMRFAGGVFEPGPRHKDVTALAPVEWNDLYWTGSDNGAVRGIDKNTLRIVFRGELGDEVSGFAVAADGEALFAGTVGGTLWRIDRR